MAANVRSSLRMRIVTFSTAEDYLRALHPECNSLFTVARTAVEHWGNSEEEAKEIQRRMVEAACVHARKRDSDQGMKVVINT